MTQQIKQAPAGAAKPANAAMYQNWRISTVSGALLAGYFIPAWTFGAFRIMVSPIQGLYERPNVPLAIYLSDHLHLAGMSTVRFAWLLAVAKLTVVAFFALFLMFTTRASIRSAGGCDEPLGMALGIGSVITFAGMIMAAKVNDSFALRLHLTELLLMLSTAILLAVEPPPVKRMTDDSDARHRDIWTSDLQSFNNPSS